MSIPSPLPSEYKWLTKEPAPLMLLEALKLFGTTEKAGAGNNPAILAWAKEVGVTYYDADSIPWCGLFMAVVAKRAGKPVVKDPLWAQNWKKFGHISTPAKLGDVLIFVRDGGGHVGLYVGEDANYYHVLGGNQGDTVSITRVAKSRCVGARNFYSIGAPDNVRRVFLTASGAISRNEE